MTIASKPLDYSLDALEPTLSARTMEYHYGKHYVGYVDKLTQLIRLTEFENMPLKEIVRHANAKPDQPRQEIFNNAAQAWNHEFFWDCLSPKGGGVPPDAVRKSLEKSFGSLDAFKTQFAEAGTRQFGSGWVWLVAKDAGLHIVTTSNAQLPSLTTCRPLLVCDLWEHAYYLDYQNERTAYLRAFLDKLLNWQFVGRRMADSGARLVA